MLDFWVHVGNMAAIYILLAISLNLLVGYTGLFSVTHGALFGVGAYASALVAINYHVPLPVALVTAIATSAMVGGAIALPSLRVSGDYLVIASIAIQVLMVAIFLNANALTGGAQGLVAIPLPSLLGWHASSPASYLPLNLVCAAAGLVLAILITRAPFGRTLKAVRDDEIAAASIGKNIVQYKLVVYIIASGMAGAAGSLFAYYLTFIDPTSFGIDVSILIFSMVIIGGSGTILGSVVGPVFVVGVTESLRFLNLPNDMVGPLRQAAYGLALILFMLLRPQGLFGDRVLDVGSGKSRRALAKANVITGTRRLEDAAANERSASQTMSPQALPPQPSASHLSVSRRSVSTLTAVPAVAKEPDGAGTRLVCHQLCAGYHGHTVLHDVSLTLGRSEIVAIVGHNGAGKSTVLKSIAGLIPVDRGHILLDGHDIANRQMKLPVEQRVGLMPQSGGVFPEMTVQENLFTAGYMRRRSGLRARVDEILTIFPILAERRGQKAVTLSGGQQRTLALAMALVPNHSVLLLDEPSIGLSPVLVETMLETVRRISTELGISVILNEQNVRPALAIADRAYVLKTGRVHLEDSASALLTRADLWGLF